MMLNLGPFRPDMTDATVGILEGLSNVDIVPDGKGIGYGPLASLIVASTSVALPAEPKGSLTCVTSEGAYVNFVMTSTNIYQLFSDGTYASIGSGYDLPPGDKWSSCQFGTKAIFTNTNDGMLEYDIQLAGAVTPIAGAPNARVVRVVFDALFAGDCDGENRLMRNSDFDYSNWSTGVSGYQPFATGGEIVGIEEIMDGIAIVLQRSAVRIIRRIPDSSLYTQSLLAANKGAINPWCIVPVNGGVYYWDADGPYRASPAGVEAIGYAKVNRWLQGRLAVAANSGTEGAYDPQRDVIRWRYEAGTDNGSEVFANCIDFHPKAGETGEFVPVEEPTTALYTTSTPGYTMEELDVFGDLDSLGESLDSRVWFGGSPQIAGLDEDYRLGFFSGPPLAASFETSTISNNESSRINFLRPVTDSVDITVQVGRSDRLADALTWNTAAGLQPSGRIALSAPTRGKNHRFRAEIPAGKVWTFINGFDDINPAIGGPK